MTICNFCETGAADCMTCDWCGWKYCSDCYQTGTVTVERIPVSVCCVDCLVIVPDKGAGKNYAERYRSEETEEE